MQQLTKEQAIILTGFTGILMVQNTSDFHEDVERRLGRPVFTHEFADPHGEIKEAYRADFEKLIGQWPKQSSQAAWLTESRFDLSKKNQR